MLKAVRVIAFRWYEVTRLSQIRSTKVEGSESKQWHLHAVCTDDVNGVKLFMQLPFFHIVLHKYTILVHL